MPTATVTTKTLELYFHFPWILRRHRTGFLGPFADGLAAALREHGYSRQYVRVVVCVATRFSEYLRRIGIRDSRDIHDGLAARFCADLQAQGQFRHAARAIRIVLDHLRREGVIPNVSQEPRKQDSGAELLRGYEKYLTDVRGVVAS